MTLKHCGDVGRLRTGRKTETDMRGALPQPRTDARTDPPQMLNKRARRPLLRFSVTDEEVADPVTNAK